MMESLFGAIFVSEGLDIRLAHAVYTKLIKPFFETYIDPEVVLSPPGSVLFAKFGAAKCQDYQFKRSNNGGQAPTKFQCTGEHFVTVKQPFILCVLLADEVSCGLNNSSSSTWDCFSQRGGGQ